MTLVAPWSLADHDFVTAMQSYDVHNGCMSYGVNVRFIPYRV